MGGCHHGRMTWRRPPRHRQDAWARPARPLPARPLLAGVHRLPVPGDGRQQLGPGVRTQYHPSGAVHLPPPPSTAQNHPPQGASPPPNQATPPRGMHGAQGGAGSPASPTASLWWCTCAKEEAAGGTEKRAAAPRSETKPLSKPNRPEQCVARETVVRTVPGMEEEVSGGGGQKNGKGGEGCRMASSSGQREWNSESTTPIPIKGVWVAPRNLMSPPRGHPLSGPQWNAEPFRSKR